MDEASIFLEALHKPTPAERAAYLDGACAGDAELRRSVDMLLKAHAQAGDFLNKTPADFGPTVDQPLAERPGTVIGPYKLLQQIGEGGMGAVFMAEQTQPVQRKVALKVIKPGMDSRQVIARFEAERQALAMMDHVNIARVFDAGTTEAGRPYFVMELVHGEPITKYCDDNHLTPRQRLELFVPVCQAIQHAHQKGIIHRDVKPSNVMVTLYDGKPVPKVIDFGVAKATEQKLTERTLFTQYGTLVGTLEYMSPEQAEMSALGVDTRSDIFSLGVLLYELLTGSTPLSRKRIKEAAYAEILRLIKEEEPPKPSTRLSDSGEALASISAQRNMEPAKLTKLVRGELDWIVMKTLEKDRDRRYETANGLAQDVQRYLQDEAVEACPPSAAYRLRKFVRRNRGPVLAAAGVFLALLAGLIGTGLALSVARSERNAKAIAYEQADANFRQARDAVDQFLTGVGDSPDLKTRGLDPLRRQLLAKAKEFYENFARQHADITSLQAELALAFYRLAEIERRMGNLTAAEKLYDQARDRYADLEQAEPGNPERRRRRSDVLNDVALIYKGTNRRQEAESTWQKALAAREQLRGEFPENQDYASAVAATQINLGLLHQEDGRFDQALTEYRNALAIHEDLFRATPENVKLIHMLAASHYNLGKLYLDRKEFQKSEPDVEQAIAGWRQATAKDPAEPDYADNLARAYINRGLYFHSTKRPKDAVDDWHLALQSLEKLTREHPHVPTYLLNFAKVCSNLSILEMAARKQEDSLRHLRLATDALERLLQSNPNDLNYAMALAESEINLSGHFMGISQYEPALASCDKALLTLTETAKKNPQLIGVRERLRKAHENRGGSLSRLGRHDAALDAIDQAAKYDDAKAPQLAVNRAVVLARRGDHAKAVALADSVVKVLPPGDHNDRCVLAGVYANASAAAAKDAALPEPDRRENAKAYAGRALQLLRDAQAAGFFKDPANIRELKTTEKDMAPLRELPEFKELLKKAEAELGK